MKMNDFDKELKYNLYRNVKEILHPTISKRNISNYKIIINEDLMPLRIFYPKRVSNIENIVIYIHGDAKITNCHGKYSNISADMALEYNQLVISFDYENYNDLKLLDLYSKFYETFKYIYLELLENGITEEKITLIGDSTGTNAVNYLLNNMVKDNIKISKQILFYPLVSGEYFGKSKFSSLQEEHITDKELLKKVSNYFSTKTKYKKDLKDENIFALLKKDFSNYPETLIICGNGDIFLEEAKKLSELLQEKSTLVEIPFAFHGFLKNNDVDMIKDFQNEIKEFLMK